jgi:hypothetical protein|uniref:H(+)-transporting two-sector ATPase n=1 Tax=Trebouxiophyceae sp. MX-AZ01 TaxID=1208065 RepID=J7K6R6_9CHLO|nr:ATP synthase F0 subunit 8 [Trebouxiophyceae sp. MX-AZ01]AFQ93766.1 ATP synthase F0 subunit 8 [Trebouxiophyceae sp. MX-AZ01]
MPQLDKVTFFSQFFWLSIFYVGFYFVIVKQFLPKLSRILKVRQKKVSYSQEGGTTLLQEREKVSESLNGLVEHGVGRSKALSQENLEKMEAWLTHVVQDTNQTTLRPANEVYISALGEKSIAQNLVVDLPFLPISGRGVAALLIERIRGANSRK